MRRVFGRIHIPDSRDKHYPIRKLATRRVSRYWWANGWWGDQGRTSQCVAYAFAHWLEDGPVCQSGNAPCIKPAILYREAQRLDEWEGESYDGTSVRGAAKALTARGYISEYRWTNSLSVLISTVLEVGPVVVGTSWTEGMCEPDSRGLIHATGQDYGGHAYLIDGVNRKTALFRIKNSWGRKWGRNGFAYISFADIQRLIEEEYGECCLGIEVAK